jgi:hypothetical protein
LLSTVFLSELMVSLE